MDENRPAAEQDLLRTRAAELKRRNIKRNIGLFFGNKRAVFGVVMLLVFLAIAFIGPLLYEYDHYGYFLGPRIGAPTEVFRLGFDELGRDVLGSIIYGTKYSLEIGLLVALIIVVIGTTFGIVSGYYGGVIDIILMRITEVFMLIPYLPLILTFAAIVGQSFNNIIIILGLTSWTSTARLVRAQTMSIKQRSYVERAKSIGASDFYIMKKHILPNVFPLVFSNIILLVQNAIIAESTLAFLGIGDPTIPTWGQLLRSARENGAISAGYWWLFIPAGVCLVGLASSFVFIGYGFDEILNPKLRRR